MTQYDPAESQIRYALEQNAAQLTAASYTQDQLLAHLARLAAAFWRTQDRDSVVVNAEAASRFLPTATTPKFLQLCVDCSFLVPAGGNGLRFRDDWLHGYLTARHLVQHLAGDYSERGPIRDKAVEHLVQIGIPAIPVMIAALAEEDDLVGLGAAVVLRGIGPAAIPSVVQALTSGNDRVRRWATSALSSPANANAALPALLRVLAEDTHPVVLMGAAYALGQSQNPSAESGLIDAAFRHTEPAARMFAKQALEKFDTPRARRALDDLARPTPTHDSANLTATRPIVREQHREAPPAVSNTPRVFISYAKEDGRLAREASRLLLLAGFDPWMDSAGLLAGDAWEARLTEVIRTSDFVLALLSKHSAGGYQEVELKVAAENAPRNRRADVPFIVTCATVMHADRIAIPDFLDMNAVIEIEDVDESWRTVHERLYTGARVAGLAAPMLLRSDPRLDLDEAAAHEMIMRRNFFDCTRNTVGRPAASTLRPTSNGDLIEDPVTGRIWTRSCVTPTADARQPDPDLAVRLANEQRLGGANDWRLPTLEEAMSIMMPEKNSRHVFLSPLFSDDGYMLTCDLPLARDQRFVWVANYAFGECQQVPADAPASVRLVRTDWEHLR